MTGHLFITRGDLRHLACDAILVPSGIGPDGRRGHVQEQWRLLVGADRDSHVTQVDAADEWTVQQVGPTNLWPLPTIWLGHTGDATHTPLDDAEVLVRFVETAAGVISRALAEQPDRPEDKSDRPFGLDRPFVALPIVGTGAAGRVGRKGDVIVEIVQALLIAVRRIDIDVALVAWDDAHYAAAQQARSRYASELGDGVGYPGLRSELVEPLELLIEEADRGRLVLFLGAGASMGAGLPSWHELLDALIDGTDLAEKLDAEARRTLDSRDVATLVDLALGEDRGLGAAVCEVIGQHLRPAPSGKPRVSLIQQLLAALPVSEAVTTNYDNLFETAWEDAGRAPDVLPYSGKASAGEWLLRLHGSMDHPDDIVLARDDYMRFEGRGSALAGMVHAMLLTRHLLFVGYSLSDDNFHRIVHQVRATAGSRTVERSRVGTVLTAAPPGVLAPIWQPEMEFVSTTTDDHLDLHQQAVFLDHLAAATAAPGSHLLDPTYSRVFTPAELELRDTIAALKMLANNPKVRPRLRRDLDDALRRFGGDNS